MIVKIPVYVEIRGNGFDPERTSDAVKQLFGAILDKHLETNQMSNSNIRKIVKYGGGDISEIEIISRKRLKQIFGIQ